MVIDVPLRNCSEPTLVLKLLAMQLHYADCWAKIGVTAERAADILSTSTWANYLEYVGKRGARWFGTRDSRNTWAYVP